MDKVYIEYLGAYDGWLTWADSEGMQCKTDRREYHRIDDSLVLETKCPKEYGPIYFKTEKGYYKNLTPITKELYDNIRES